MNPLTTGFGGAYPGKRFDVILANPPFAGRVQEESILSDLNYKLNTRATELLFLKWFIDHLTADGRAGVIVPNGVLFGSTNAATKLRELLLTECARCSRLKTKSSGALTRFSRTSTNKTETLANRAFGSSVYRESEAHAVGRAEWQFSGQLHSDGCG
jgi:hypothetical protein